MIPRVIHYCWFGPNELPNSAKRYMQTWKKHLPNFEIKLWNENNFDIKNYSYAKDAYEDGKYAFVADVCRAHVLYYEGGIYLDTDVEVLKSLDSLLDHIAFAGFEASTVDVILNTKVINTQMGVIGSEPKSKWIAQVMYEFESLHYDKNNPLTINALVDKIVIEKGFELIDEFQFIEDYLYLYPSEYFIAKDYQTGAIKTSNSTYCIHHYDASWLSPYSKIKIRLKQVLIKNLNQTILKIVIKIKRKLN